MSWEVLEKKDATETKLREKEYIKINYTLLVDVDQVEESGGILPATSYQADYDEKWTCIVDGTKIVGATVKKLLDNLTEYIKLDEMVAFARVDSISVFVED